MAGILNLYVTKNGEIIKIANSSCNKNKPIKELCLQEVLHVQIMYDIQDRKPYKMLGIWFDRIEIDGLGQYVEKKNSPAIQNFLNYSLTSAEELSERECPLIIPAAPILPTQLEKRCLIDYIKDKYPKLWNSAPQIIEETIGRLQNIHKEYVKLVKEAGCLRKAGNR